VEAFPLMSDRPTPSIEQVWDEFTAQLRRFISSRVRGEADVDDILQEVFIKIHRGLDQLGDHSKLHAWVYQITRNAIIDHYRRGASEVEVPEELPDRIAEDEDPEGAEAEVATWLRPMAEDLPEKYREALLLTDIEGLTQKELAERLDISLSGAKSRVQRAREKLKDVLLECCHLEVDRLGRVIDWEPRQADCRYCTVPLTRK
jgi:RNA polymerase sigma-70 factor, ECF subfamily